VPSVAFIAANPTPGRPAGARSSCTAPGSRPHCAHRRATIAVPSAPKGSVRRLSPSGPQCCNVDNGGVAWLPPWERVDRVDLDEAPVFPERPGGPQLALGVSVKVPRSMPVARSASWIPSVNSQPGGCVLREKRWPHTEATQLALHPAAHLCHAFGESLDIVGGRVVQTHENERFSSLRDAVSHNASASTRSHASS
jgi:hypothetical protein